MKGVSYARGYPGSTNAELLEAADRLGERVQNRIRMQQAGPMPALDRNQFPEETTLLQRLYRFIQRFEKRRYY